DNVPNSCQCTSTCSTKAGRKRTGCPCKTAGRFCGEACSCSRRKPCKNRESARPPGQPDNGLTEELERDMENRRVKEFIQTLDEELAKKVATRALQRGVGSMDYIDMLLIQEDPEDENNDAALPSSLSLSPQKSSDSSISGTSTSGGPSSFRPLPTASMARSSEPVPEWCKCGHCRRMSQEVENRCCNSRDCVSLSARFRKLCLDPDYLQLSRKCSGDIRNDRQDNSSRAFRKAAYRHYIIEEYGYLGKHKRRVCPSCCVWKIREHYPSSTGVYMGFKPG
ncbi:unnamed protein product, partial [Porites lobata]